MIRRFRHQANYTRYDKITDVAKKTFIIHPGCIERDLANPGLLLTSERQRAEGALELIHATLATAQRLVVTDEIPVDRFGWLVQPQLDGDVYLLREDSTQSIRDCLIPEDEVIVMGAYTNLCVAAAVIMAESVGVKSVEISEQGCFDRKRFTWT